VTLGEDYDGRARCTYNQLEQKQVELQLALLKNLSEMENGEFHFKHPRLMNMVEEFENVYCRSGKCLLNLIKVSRS